MKRTVKASISCIVAASILTSCATVENNKSKNLGETRLDEGKPTHEETSRAVACVSSALKALRAAEYQGGARYAKENIKTAYNMLNQGINMMSMASAETVCQTVAMAEKEAKMAIYIAVSAESRAGVKKAKPKPVKLETAPLSKPKKKHIIKAAYHPKEKAAVDPLLPSNRWELAKNTPQNNMVDPLSNKKPLASNKNNTQVHDKTPIPKVDKKSLYVEDGVFYRGFNKAQNSQVKGLSNGQDYISDFIRYSVQRGDTLWWISKNVFSDPRLWPAIFESNPNIENPDRIYPGQALIFRPNMVKTEEQKERLRNKAIAWDIQRRKNKSL